MLDTTLLGSIARQLMSADEVEVEGRRLRVRHTGKQGLRTVTFAVGGREYTAIEQNPDKPSRGVNLPAVATRSSSSRICRQTGSWRSLWMARLRSTASDVISSLVSWRRKSEYDRLPGHGCVFMPSHDYGSRGRQPHG